jgi:hypothetical protein
MNLIPKYEIMRASPEIINALTRIMPIYSPFKMVFLFLNIAKQRVFVNTR